MTTDRRVTIDEIAIEFNISHGSAYNIGGNGCSVKFVKGHAKKLLSRGHPQACGQADQVCCEAGRLCRRIRHKQVL